MSLLGIHSCYFAGFVMPDLVTQVGTHLLIRFFGLDLQSS